MYIPAPDDITRAFGLGRPVGGLIHVRRGDAEAWRLDTASGRYFVKGYFGTTGGQFHGEGLADQLAVAMAFERLALEAGVDMSEPVVPVDPLVGWVARIEERLFRVYRWIEHQPSPPDREVSAWLGRTMAEVHQLQPVGRVGLPRWWRDAIQAPATWEGWFAKGRGSGASWAGLSADALPHILAVTARIAELCDVAPDIVTTHGDFKPHNLVMSPDGPVLVDWDSVRSDSAALEAGRVAYIFGAGEPERVGGILSAYVVAGGDLGWAGPDLFLSVARNQLQVLAEQLRVALGEAPAARWMGDRAAINDAIGNQLRDLPGKLDRLRRLGSLVGHL